MHDNVLPFILSLELKARKKRNENTKGSILWFIYNGDRYK